MIYLELFLNFFNIGLFTFGGGYAMIPLIKETVLKYGWLTEAEFYNFIGVCESTPGPMAVNMATYIGSIQGGILGSILATLGVVLPSFIIIVLVASILKRFMDNRYFKAILEGIKPVVIALILASGLILIIKCLGYNSLDSFTFDLKSLIIFVLISIIYLLVKIFFKKKLNTVLLIIISAFLGIGVCMIFN